MTIKPAHCYQVEIKLRSEFADAEGQAALGLLHSVGLSAAREVRSSRVYEISGAINSAHVQQAARDLLCDPVTQEFRVISPSEPVLNGMSHWRVEVWLKPSVSDPVGDTVRSAIAEMGLPKPENVRVATVYHISGKCGRNQLERAIARGLANPVIHKLSVTETHA